MLSTRFFRLFVAGIAFAAGPLACSGGDGSGTPTDDGVGDAGTSDGGGGGGDGGGGGADSGPPATLTWAAGTITGDGAANVGGISAMAFGGGKFVAFATAARGAVDNNGYALASTDGKAWTVVEKYGLNSTIRGITYTGTGFLATGVSPDGEGGRKAIYATSADGTAWTFKDAPGPGTNAIASTGTIVAWGGEEGKTTTFEAATAVAKASDPLPITVYSLCSVGDRFLASGQILPTQPTTSPLFFYTDSPKAGPWTAGKDPNTVAREASRILDLYCDASEQIAVGAGREVFRSTDRGATWADVGGPGDSTTWNGVEKANGKVVLVGWKGAYGVLGSGGLSTGNLGSGLDFGPSASNGTIVVAASTSTYNSGLNGVFRWTSP